MISEFDRDHSTYRGFTYGIGRNEFSDTFKVFSFGARFECEQAEYASYKEAEAAIRSEIDLLPSKFNALLCV